MQKPRPHRQGVNEVQLPPTDRHTPSDLLAGTGWPFNKASPSVGKDR